MKNIAIFASGRGSNAASIIEYFHTDTFNHVALIVSNKKNAGVLDLAKTHKIPDIIIKKKELSSGKFLSLLKNQYQIDLIVLAGFLLLIPKDLINSFPKRIINIHPSLIPKYSGKGMYGTHIHNAVKENQEKETGITIHFVNDKFDEGEIIAQIKCAISTTDSAERIGQKVLKLEHQYYPQLIKQILETLK